MTHIILACVRDCRLTMNGFLIFGPTTDNGPLSDVYVSSDEDNAGLRLTSPVNHVWHFDLLLHGRHTNTCSTCSRWFSGHWEDASSSAGEGRWGGGAVVDRGHYTACSRHSIMLCQLWIRMLWLMPVSCVPETDDSNDSSSSIAAMLCLLMNFLLVMRFCVTGLGRRASAW